VVSELHSEPPIQSHAIQAGKIKSNYLDGGPIIRAWDQDVCSLWSQVQTL
jgi:hypothetical protein